MKRRLWRKHGDGKWRCVSGKLAWDSWLKRLLIRLNLLDEADSVKT